MPGKRNHIAVGVLFAIQGGRAGDAQALGATDFAPDIGVLAHHFDEQAELGAIDWLGHVGAAHVIDHHGRRQCREKVVQLGQIHCLKINDHVPAERCNAIRDLEQHFTRREISQTPDEVKARTAHTGSVHLLQLSIGHIAVDGSHTTGLVVGGLQRINQCAVVGAVAGRLHDHIFIEPQVVAQCKKLILAGIAGRVFAFRRVGEQVAGAKHVAVRIHCANRKFEGRFAGPGVPVEPAGSFGEAVAC